MADAATANKVVTLETLGVAVQKIKTDYPTRTEVTQEIGASGGGNVEYATEAEVLALFDDSADNTEGTDTGQTA